MMKRDWWHALETLHSGAVLREWALELGNEFEAARHFLVPTNDAAETFPCTSRFPCACRHRVEPGAEGSYVAVCDCADRCAPIPLLPADILTYALDKTKLASATARALGLNLPTRPPQPSARVIEIGTCGPMRSPVYLAFGAGAPMLAAEAERLLSTQPDPFVLLTPAGAHCSPETESALRRHYCAHIPLSSLTSLAAGGTLLATPSAATLLAHFTRRLAERPTTAPLLEGLHRKIDAANLERAELRGAKARLEQMTAEGLLKFAGRIDPKSFKVIYAILASGDIAKAARQLGMKDSTLREFIAKWKRRGKDYALLADLVRWRKATHVNGTVPLNESVLVSQAPQVNHAQLLSDVLDGLLEMTDCNWEDKCEELTDLLRPHVRV